MIKFCLDRLLSGGLPGVGSLFALFSLFPPHAHRPFQVLIGLLIFSAAVTWESPVSSDSLQGLTFYATSTERLLKDLQMTDQAAHAEERLLPRMKTKESRKLLRAALQDPTFSLAAEPAESAFRRLARINLGFGSHSMFQDWNETMELATSTAQKAVVLELICQSGLDEAGRFYLRQPQKPAFQLACLRGFSAALERDSMTPELKRELTKRLIEELVGIPVSSNPDEPSPASLLIRLVGDAALAQLSQEAVLDRENPRLAENLAAMTRASMLLPLSVHETLIRNLQVGPDDEPIEGDALTEAVAMLGLRGDDASRDRLQKMKQNARMRAGALRGLALMSKEKN